MGTEGGDVLDDAAANGDDNGLFGGVVLLKKIEDPLYASAAGTESQGNRFSNGKS